MTALQRLEICFQDYLFNSPSQINPDTETEIFKQVVSTARVSAQVRLNIYANAYRARLQEALVASYPVVQAYLGEADFILCCDRYIDAYPSSFRSIRWFGDCFDVFLATASSLPGCVPELARLEWALGLVFDAADAPVLGPEVMQSFPHTFWDTMVLTPHPAVRRLRFSWNVVEIWQAIVDHKTLPLAQCAAVPVPWVLWRKEWMSRFCALSATEAWAVDQMIAGAPFGEICEGLCEWVLEEEIGVYAASLLKGWLHSGLISVID
jgi:hypothetical protein